MYVPLHAGSLAIPIFPFLTQTLILLAISLTQIRAPSTPCATSARVAHEQRRLARSEYRRQGTQPFTPSPILAYVVPLSLSALPSRPYEMRRSEPLQSVLSGAKGPATVKNENARTICQSRSGYAPLLRPILHPYLLAIAVVSARPHLRERVHSHYAVYVMQTL
ncbi:hypothetical protein MVEN_01653400 [Mycena venus]|uniref:Uncharacterized protein n=1 Tax=Mycena venus TaxID=2733690 RepID=A0A8H6XNB6_9AGAR|nr:hypothetical protein MVEN_01653400 [Mycena venus]